MSEPESVRLMKQCAPMKGLHYTLQFGELREVVDYIEQIERERDEAKKSVISATPCTCIWTVTLNMADGTSSHSRRTVCGRCAYLAAFGASPLPTTSKETTK